MKKPFGIINQFCYIVVLLFLVTFIPSVSSQGGETQEVGMIKAVSGKVWLCRDGKKEEAVKMMELRENDVLEIDNQSSASLIYYKGRKMEQYTSKAILKIGVGMSVVQEGSAAVVQESQGSKILVSKLDDKNLYSENMAHAGGQFIRSAFQPKQYFEDKHIKRYAVVVGISDYKDKNIPALKYADADAQSFYHFIQSPVGGGFRKENILLLKNEQATLKNVKIAMTNFLEKVKDIDLVALFIVCHGGPDRSGNLYLLMHDSDLGNLSATAYGMENVNADMRQCIAAKKLIFFADVCHVNGFSVDGSGAKGSSNSINVSLSSLKTDKEGWGVVTASQVGEVSAESSLWGDGHGAFTHYLLEGLKRNADIAGNNNGIVTLPEVFDYLGEKVKRATANVQHPEISGNFDNNIPLGFPFLDTAGEKDQDLSQPVSCVGFVNINSTPQGAAVYIGIKECGVTPFLGKMTMGTYPVTIKKNGYADATDMVFVNPDEKTDVSYVLRSVEAGKRR